MASKDNLLTNFVSEIEFFRQFLEKKHYSLIPRNIKRSLILYLRKLSKLSEVLKKEVVRRRSVYSRVEKDCVAFFKQLAYNKWNRDILVALSFLARIVAISRQLKFY